MVDGFSVASVMNLVLQNASANGNLANFDIGGKFNGPAPIRRGGLG
jgi:hypothetical protein